MTLSDIYQQFQNCKFWEESYRLLIKLSRQLPQPTPEELAQTPEIKGCESRLWFRFEPETNSLVAYSDARLMQGILMIIRVALLEKTPSELAQFDLEKLFAELQISRHLTSTRLNGIRQIQQQIAQALTT